MSLPYPTTAYLLRLDATATARATALIPATQAGYDASRVNNPALPPETIDAADVCTIAVQNGLNYWQPPRTWQLPGPPDQPSASTFVSHAGTGVTTVSVAVWDESVIKAGVIIAALSNVPDITDVLGCAVCTGLALMSSLYTVEGPFT